MKRILPVLGLLCVASLLAGCNTPASRINRSLALFNTLPAPEQELIKQGRVAVGFTADMVKLALGDPDRIYARTDALGQSESWVYTTWGARRGGAFYYRGYYHHLYPALYPFWTDFDEREELERCKVTLKDGKVTVIEEMNHS
jgi:hypothetical protein